MDKRSHPHKLNDGIRTRFCVPSTVPCSGECSARGFQSVHVRADDTQQASMSIIININKLEHEHEHEQKHEHNHKYK
jgi:hypothetical protein